MSTYATTYGGAVYLSFGDKVITLTADDIKNPRFSYKADSFYTALSLGTIDTAIETIITKFNEALGQQITPQKIKEQIEELKTTIPPLAFVLNSDLVITEFTVQPENPEGANNGYYAFGFGLRTSPEDGKLGPVKLDGIAFSVQLKQ